MLFGLFNKPFLLFGKTALPKELADPRRILLTHFGSTAEIIRSIPVLIALRHRFPYADIAWLIEEETAPLILDHWAVNRFIVVRNDWTKHLSEVRRVRKRLRSFAPQVVVDTQNTFGSSLATWLSGAKYRIGFGGKQARYLHNIHVVAEETHHIDKNRQLLQPFGIVGSGIGFDMPDFEKDCLAAQHILSHAGVHGNFAMFHISAGHPSARWQEERFGAVAKYLLEQWNLPTLITWSNHEEFSRAEAAVYAADGAAHHAPWMTTLVERKALSQLATLFVGSDTAELQVAAAVGTTCVGLFGPTSALENSPFGREHRMLQSHHRSSLKKRKHLTSEWMDAIPVESVCAKCDEILIEKTRKQTVVPMQVAPVQRKAA